MKECPADKAQAFLFASSIRASSLPAQRTRHGPDDSQKARPNLMPGAAWTKASYRSSTVLIK